MDKRRYVLAGLKRISDLESNDLNEYAVSGLIYLAQEDPEVARFIRRCGKLIERVLTVSTANERQQLRRDLDAAVNNTWIGTAAAVGRMVIADEARAA